MDHLLHGLIHGIAHGVAHGAGHAAAAAATHHHVGHINYSGHRRLDLNPFFMPVVSCSGGKPCYQKKCKNCCSGGNSTTKSCQTREPQPANSYEMKLSKCCRRCKKYYKELDNTEMNCVHHHGRIKGASWTCCGGHEALVGCCKGYHAEDKERSRSLQQYDALQRQTYEQNLTRAATTSTVPETFSEASGNAKLPTEGYLTKRGHIVMNWKQRYFRIHGDQVTYYRDKSETIAIGEISLIKCEISLVYMPNKKDDTSHFLEIYDAIADKKFYLHAATEEETKLWYKSLRSKVDRMAKAMPIVLNSNDVRLVSTDLNVEIDDWTLVPDNNGQIPLQTFKSQQQLYPTAVDFDTPTGEAPPDYPGIEPPPIYPGLAERNEKTPEVKSLPNPDSGFAWHQVGPNDTLAGIAIKYRTTVELIRNLNKLPLGTNIVTRSFLYVPKTKSPEEVAANLKEQKDRKRKLKQFMQEARIDLQEEALHYLEQSNWNLFKAREQYIEDLEFERQERMKM